MYLYIRLKVLYYNDASFIKQENNSKSLVSLNASIIQDRFKKYVERIDES